MPLKKAAILLPKKRINELIKAYEEIAEGNYIDNLINANRQTNLKNAIKGRGYIMRKSTPKIIVKPHYTGTEKNTEIIKRILQEQIENKLKSRKMTAFVTK